MEIRLDVNTLPGFVLGTSWFNDILKAHHRGTTRSNHNSNSVLHIVIIVTNLPFSHPQTGKLEIAISQEPPLQARFKEAVNQFDRACKAKQ